MSDYRSVAIVAIMFFAAIPIAWMGLSILAWAKRQQEARLRRRPTTREKEPPMSDYQPDTDVELLETLTALLKEDGPSAGSSTDLALLIISRLRAEGLIP